MAQKVASTSRALLAHLLAAVVGAALALAISLPRQTDRLREGLPKPVQPAVNNPRLNEEIEGAEQAARESPTLAKVAALGRLYHANGYDQAAARCWRLLAREDETDGHWTHYLAQLARIRSDQDEISRQLAATVRRSPDYSPAWLQQADLAFKRSRYALARQSYERRLALEPGDAHARLGLARLALIDFDRDAAKAQLLAIIGDHPQFSAAHNLFAQLATEDGNTALAQHHRWLGHQAGRFEQARDPWMLEIEAECYDPGRLRILGMREYQNRRYDNAREMLQRAIAIQPTDPNGYELLGNVHLNTGQPAQAAQLTQEAKVRYAQTGQVVPIAVFSNLAQALQETDRAGEAVTILQEGLRTHPESFELLNTLGVALRMTDQSTAAIEAFRAALEINPLDPDTNFNLATLLYNRGAEEEALFHYHQSLKRKPTYPQTLLFLATRELSAGNLDAAQPWIERLFDAYSGVPEVRRITAQWHLQRGLGAERAGNASAALAAFAKAFEIDAALPGLAPRLGGLYLEAGQFAQAVAPLEAYHAQEPNTPRAAMLLAQAYARTRRFAEARQLLTQAADTAAAAGDEKLAAFCREILGQLPRR